MSDRELLEAASKAAGMSDRLVWWELAGCFQVLGDTPAKLWNPLTDDGDALRLAVKLKLDLTFYSQGIHVMALDAQPYADDAMAATRRAIVRSAAEIGRAEDGRGGT
ncbi:hypothetical protein D3C86_1395210 [compost metagenome]